MVVETVPEIIPETGPETGTESVPQAIPANVPADWPHRSRGRAVEADGLCWHVQEFGSGPDVLLLHGTGASAHSWAGVAPLLAAHFHVLVPDLPGQGFSDAAETRQCSLEGMSRAVGVLLGQLNASPSIVVGHSAGAAIAASLCLRGSCSPDFIVSINGAMLPFGRAAAPFFSRAAKLLAAAPVFPQLVALHAVPAGPVQRMVRQTGSTLPDDMVRCYRRLVGNPRHVSGTLRMMANWDLSQLERNLDRLEPALHLLVCDNDRVVSPAQSDELATRLPDAILEHIPDLGHLGHEEEPALFADYVLAAARARGLVNL